jgi:wobble nucleotide-excising tRNase
MIIKLNQITNFGNYRNFEWGTNPSFKKRNLIYGWNYSGKTTLSRLFHILENPNEVSKWHGCKFDVELQDGYRLTQANLSTVHVARIKVFNRDFIQSNFLHENKAPAVFIVGESAIQLRSRIKRLNEHATTVNAIKGRVESKRQSLQKELDNLGTSSASAVALLTGDKTYNRPKLNADIGRIKATPEAFILAEESLQGKLTLLRSTDEWRRIELIAIAPVNLTLLHKELTDVVRKTASNQAISSLKDNRELEAWVRTGLQYHKDVNQCEFCGSTISPDRLSDLRKHFSEEYNRMVGDLEALLEKIEGVIPEFALPDERDFIPGLRGPFGNLKASLFDWVKWADKAINEFMELVRQKQIAIESELDCAVNVGRASELNQIISEINSLIENHNQKLLKLDKEKKEAKEEIERHHAAVFYKDYEIWKRVGDIDRESEKVGKADALLQDIAQKRAEIELLIQQQSIAAEKINGLVNFILPDNNISVAEAPDGAFEFKRAGVLAYNLSEGEKTAIAFAYFLATLEDNGASLDQTIVFIDDPISSLDSNHVYAIYALLTRKLDDCLQIFVSTHNNELYTLLKDSWFVAAQKYNNTKDASAYYTRRFLGADNQWHSTLEDMPGLLRKYKSEYQFTFEQLHKFSSSPNPSVYEAYTSPNLLRKFLEAYLGFQKPCVPQWYKKLDLLFDTDFEQTEIQKFADDASHLQGLNRALQQPNFVPNSQNTVKKVIQALKEKDNPHYISLCTVIGVTP